MRKKRKEVITPKQNQMIFEAIQQHQQGNLDVAQKQYRKLLNIIPNNLVLINNLAAIAIQQGDFVTALETFNQSLAIQANQPSVWNNKGNILKHLHQEEEALVSYEKAIKFQPSYMIAHFNKASILTSLKKYDEAIDSYNRAILFNKDSVAQYYHKDGNIFQNLDQYIDFIYGDFLWAKMSICCWDDFNKICDATTTRITQGYKASAPFCVIAFSDNPDIQKQSAQTYVNVKCRPQATSTDKYAKQDKIKIGYYSADFHNHATSYLMAGLFEKHDKSKFEIYGFSFGPQREDEMRQRVVQAFDKFIDISSKTNEEIVDLSRELKIDIAVDLKGFTKDARTQLFANRVAPIQVNYLGYPGTMAAPYIDYIIADKTLIKEEDQPYYAEKVAYLPHSYQPNDRQRKISSKHFVRADFGLPEDAFIFCSFNQSYKITPQVFDCWMDILKSVDNSILWLLEENDITIRHLKEEAEARGVDASGLIFTNRMPTDEHLARQKLADLFLDSYPCNAHTTCSDALWVGLPVLTLCGKSFASRVSASLLRAIDVPELISTSLTQYKEKALELAASAEKLQQLKEKLANNKLTTPLFDIKSFTHDIEQLYRKMYDRYHLDLVPDNIEID